MGGSGKSISLTIWFKEAMAENCHVLHWQKLTDKDGMPCSDVAADNSGAKLSISLCSTFLKPRQEIIIYIYIPFPS